MDITAYTVAAGATFDGGAIEASISLNDIEGDVSASLIDSNGSFAITSGGSVKLKAKDNSNVSAYGGGASGASRKKKTPPEMAERLRNSRRFGLWDFYQHTRGPYQPESFV